MFVGRDQADWGTGHKQCQQEVGVRILLNCWHHKIKYSFPPKPLSVEIVGKRMALVVFPFQSLETVTMHITWQRDRKIGIILDYPGGTCK